MMTPSAVSQDLPPQRPLTRLAGLVAIALTLLPLAACSPQGSAAAGAPAMPALPVSVVTAQRQPLPMALEAIGETQGSREVAVPARVAGVLERQLFQEGNAVKAGQPLFSLERDSYANAVQQAKAELAQRQALASQAHREQQRLKALSQSNAVPSRDYDEAVTTARQADAALSAAQAALATAQLNLGYTTLRAPIAGISGHASRSVGNLLNPSTDTALTTISQTNPLWVNFALSASEAAQLRRGAQHGVTLTDAAGKPLLEHGQINFTASTVNPRLGTVQLRAEFANPKLAVLPGQFVRVHLLGEEQSVFRVPQVAVMQTEEGYQVWVARDGKAVAVPVQAGPWSGQDWVIEQGLQEGDQVIVDNLIKLQPGAPVAAQASKPAAAPASKPAATSATTAASAATATASN